MSSAGQITALNTFGASGLVSRSSGRASTFYAFDERGSVAQRTSSTGAVTSSDLYDGFGKLLAGGAAGDPWGYGAQDGYYTDTETGLLLCTHRFYDPQQGRWLTRDPIGYAGGVNLYGYTQNNPINRVDPFGLWTFGIGLKAGATGGVGGFGLSGGVKFDSTGTVSLYGSFSVLFGPGTSVNLGPTVSVSPGNLPAPDATGLSRGGGLAFGGSVTVAPANVSVTFPQKPAGGFGTPTFSLSPGVGSNLGVQGQIGGSVGVNIPIAVNNIGKLFRPAGMPFGGDPFPYNQTACH